MCGVAGIIRFDGQPVDEAALRRMSEKIAHRGPDDDGLFIGPSVGLVHRRLSILDLSDAGHQPMRDDSRRAVLSYNGEVYNFRELRRRLTDEGCAFHSTGDTEVILQACRTWGVPAAAREMNGMFAFAYWDESLRELWLCRDRTGIKPLYYHVAGDRLVFASEVKALLGEVQSELDESALLSVLLPVPLHDPHTLFCGIRSLEAGQALRVSTGGKREYRTFYRLAEGVDRELYRELERSSDEAVIARVGELTSSAVALHLASDAPVATLCSGGLDSSLVAALSKDGLPQLQAYHAHVTGTLSELHWAEVAAQHCHLPLHVAETTPETYLRNLPLVTYANECPVAFHPNTVPFFEVCRLASRDGIKVLMTGEGADELFGGYAAFRANLRRRRLAGWLKRLSQAFSVLGGRRLGRLAEWLGSDAHDGLRSWPAALTMRARSVVPIDEARELYSFVEDPVEREYHADLFGYLHGYLQAILWRNDRMGMVVGLENRVPYLENDLIRYAVNLPLRFKQRGKTNKWALRRFADAHVPRAISRRSKMGFPVEASGFVRPRIDFFRNGFLQDALDLGEQHIQLLAQYYPDSYFRFVAVELWGRIFFRSQELDQVSEDLLAATMPAGASRIVDQPSEIPVTAAAD